MKGSKRIIANIIACVLLFTMFTTSVAYGGVTTGTNESGGGGFISQSAPLAIRANGVILGLEMVKNTTTVAEQEKIEEQQQEFINDPSKLFIDEVGFSTINQYLYEYPEFLCHTDLTERYALVIRDTAEKKDIDVTKQVLVDGTGRRSEMPFKKVYRCASKGTVSDYTFPTLFSGTLSDEDKKAFMAGELGMDRVKSYVSAHKTELDSAVASFAKIFTQMGYSR